MPAPLAPPHTAVECATASYFRCTRLCATITARQCRLNRDRSDLLHGAIPAPELEGARVAACQGCRQAPYVDASSVRWFTAEQVAAGLAYEPPAAGRYPWEQRISADLSDAYFFSSAFWVPECEL